MSWRSCTAIRSAYAPPPTMAMTSSPGCHDVARSPISAHPAAELHAGDLVRHRWTRIEARRCNRSARLRAVATTSTTTSSGPGTGSGTSRRVSTSGSPYDSSTTALMAGRYPRPAMPIPAGFRRSGRGYVAPVDFSLGPELLALRDEARTVGRRAAAELEVREDAWIVGTSRAFSLELAERGWIGMTWPIEEGGHGRSALERFVVFEALISAGAPVATSWFADRQIGPTLLQYGTPEQRRRFLPDIVSGTSAWSIGMSEPDAGSDVAAIRTTADREGDEFVVTGTKIWTSGAAEADWCYLIARTDPEAPPHAGLSELIVDLSSPGVTVSPITDMTGNRHFCEVVYDRRPRAGGEPGRPAERQLRTGHAPDGARAGRHRPARQQPSPVRGAPRPRRRLRPAGAPAGGRARGRLPRRTAAGAARGARAGAAPGSRP